MDQPFRTVPRTLAAHFLEVERAGHDARLICELASLQLPVAAPIGAEERRSERARMAAILGVADQANTINGLVQLWMQAQAAADALRGDVAVALATGRVELSPDALRRAYLGRGL